MKSLAVLLLLSATCDGRRSPSDCRNGNRLLLGGSVNGKWVKPEKAAKSMKGRTAFRVFGLTQEIGKVTGGQTEICRAEVCADMLDGVVVVSSRRRADRSERAMERPAPQAANRRANPASLYRCDARIPGARGVSDPKVRITRILRVDLDGDGEDEALISATNYFTKDGGVPMDTPAPGSYSIVLLRRVVAGKVQTELIAGELYT